MLQDAVSGVIVDLGEVTRHGVARLGRDAAQGVDGIDGVSGTDGVSGIGGIGDRRQHQRAQATELEQVWITGLAGGVEDLGSPAEVPGVGKGPDWIVFLIIRLI